MDGERRPRQLHSCPVSAPSLGGGRPHSALGMKSREPAFLEEQKRHLSELVRAMKTAIEQPRTKELPRQQKAVTTADYSVVITPARTRSKRRAAAAV
jgi:hypothetical protein